MSENEGSHTNDAEAENAKVDEECSELDAYDSTGTCKEPEPTDDNHQASQTDSIKTKIFRHARTAWGLLPTFFTGAVAVTTVLLWLNARDTLLQIKEDATEQTRQFNDQFKIMEQNAAAAQKSADAAVEAATANQRIAKLEVPILSVDFSRDGPVWFKTIHIKNIGRSPAKLVEVRRAWWVGEISPPPIDPNDPVQKALAKGSGGHWVGTGDNIRISSLLPEEQVIRPPETATKEEVFYYGYVRYEAIDGRRFVQGFCLHKSLYNDRPFLQFWPFPVDGGAALDAKLNYTIEETN